jgi:hypothetical protein
MARDPDEREAARAMRALLLAACLAFLARDAHATLCETSGELARTAAVLARAYKPRLLLQVERRAAEGAARNRPWRWPDPG